MKHPSSNGSDTDDLLQLAGDGDDSARSQLLAKHRDRLRQMISVRMDRRLMNRVDPSDIVQDVLFKANQRLDEYAHSRPLPFYPWLRQFAWDRLVELQRFHMEGLPGCTSG